MLITIAFIILQVFNHRLFQATQQLKKSYFPENRASINIDRILNDTYWQNVPRVIGFTYERPEPVRMGINVDWEHQRTGEYSWGYNLRVNEFHESNGHLVDILLSSQKRKSD